MFVTKEGKKVNTDNPKMVYDTYSDKGWWNGTIDNVSLYNYLGNNPPTMKVSKRIYNEAMRHGVTIQKISTPEGHNYNRYPRPWLDMLFDVVMFDLGEKIKSNN